MASATLHLCLLLLPLLVSRWMFQLLIGSRIIAETVIYDLAGPFKTALGRVPLAVMFWFPTANIAQGVYICLSEFLTMFSQFFLLLLMKVWTLHRPQLGFVMTPVKWFG